jgi:thiamine pyrophosphate-dependent acetolactate synthase large subunit-like protein
VVPNPRLEGRASLAPVTSDSEIKPQHLMMEIDRLSGGEAIVCSDVGQHQMWAAQLIRFNEPRLWINSGGLGAMGFGLPSAIGAQFARPDKLVFALVRRWRIPDVHPGARHHRQHGLPIKIVVMNNGYLGMVRQWQELFYNNRLSSVELDCFPDAEKLAGAYGFKGRTIDKPWELASGAGRSRPRTRPVSAQRQGIAVRKRLSDGAGRRRHQRNGAGAAPTGGRAQSRISYVADHFLVSRKQAGRADAHHRLTEPARL